MRLSALRLPPFWRGSCNSLTSLGRHAPREGKVLPCAKARRTCRRRNGRRGMMPPARSSRESIATCSSSGARADISRAAAPGAAVGIKAIAWRAAGTAFPTKPASQRKFEWPPKRHRTQTASPERPTIMRLVRSASTNPKNQNTRAQTRGANFDEIEAQLLLRHCRALTRQPMRRWRLHAVAARLFRRPLQHGDAGQARA